MILTLEQQKLAEGLFSTAEKHLYEGTLAPVALLVNGDGGMGIVPLQMSDDREKMMSAKVVNVMAKMSGAEMVVWISEAWFVKDQKLDEKGDPIPPSQRDDRAETLMALVAVPSGEIEMLSAPIKRTPDGKAYCEGRQWQDDSITRRSRLLKAWALDA